MLQDPTERQKPVATLVSELVKDQLPPLAQEFKMLSLIAKFQTFGFMIKDRLQGEKGATAVEYGIMVALIAVAIIVAVTLLGGNLTNLFGKIACVNLKTPAGTWNDTTHVCS